MLWLASGGTLEAPSPTCHDSLSGPETRLRPHPPTSRESATPPDSFPGGAGTQGCQPTLLFDQGFKGFKGWGDKVSLSQMLYF